MALLRLQRDIAAAEASLSNGQAAQLVEANEQLVLAALRAHQENDEMARAFERVSNSAELDGLTELPNRKLMLDRFEQGIATAKRQGTRLGLLFIDIDRFKQINDVLGHAAGDEVLKIAAQCLRSAVRETDTVSRHGGDEFLILLNGIGQISDAELIAGKVIAELSATRRMGSHELRLAASIGISVYPEDGADAATLIAEADAAMYRAKRGIAGMRTSGGKHAPGTPQQELPGASSQPSVVAHLGPKDVGGQPWHLHLREANEQLVLKALGAQRLQVTLENAIRRQTEFLAMTAHELRNPLGPIRHAAVLLGRSPAVDELPSLQAVIERQVEHLSRLASDLLDVSRMSTGKLHLQIQTVDMTELIHAAAEAFKPRMHARRQRLEVCAPLGVAAVQGDPVRLMQVVSNLLDNAAKYTPEEGEIRLSLESSCDLVVIGIIDNGIGISAAAIPTLFDQFRQDPRAVAFNGVGLGVGLSIVRQLVLAHGGTVTAHSAGLGQGSRFVVTLAQSQPA